MKFSNLIPLFLCSQLVASSPAKAENRGRPPFVIEAGDSTTAHDFGWGDGFNMTLRAPARASNYGKNGATTHSYRADRSWDKVLNRIGKEAASNVWVTLSFGHNDQKPNSGVTIDEYKTNLARFIDDVRDRGARPIVVTSLTRRRFKDGKVVEDLAAQRKAAVQVAKKKGSMYIDLNAASERYCNKIGAKRSQAYNRKSSSDRPDTTHLNERGGAVFGRLVSDLLVDKYAEHFKDWTVPNAKLSKNLKAGRPA